MTTPRLPFFLAVTLTVVATACRAQAQASPYWSDAWRGWHFYELPDDEEPPPPRPAPPPAARPAQPSASTAAVRPAARAPELLEFERQQKTLEEWRNIAIIRPTEANVRRYMAFESRIVAQASTFADVAQRVAWSTPELDPTLQGRPVNARALEVFEQQQAASRSQTVAALGRDHVLLFFFRGDCPYCHAFAPTLQAFQARHGLQVVPVSIDGGSMPGFPQARRDNGIATALKVTQVPAVYLAQPGAGRITPIGFGVLSESQLLERLGAVAAPAADEPLPRQRETAALPWLPAPNAIPR